MTEKVTKPRPRKKRDSKVPIRERSRDKQPQESPNLQIRTTDLDLTLPAPVALVSTTPNFNPAIIGRPPPEGVDPLTALRWRYRLPMYFQPNMEDIFDRAFISHFIAVNNPGQVPLNVQLPWITKIPDMQAYSNKPALRLSIRAASMAFYGKVHQDMAVLTDSYKWYVKGLNYQRQSIQSLDPRSIPSDDDILVPIILALYEVFAGTTPMSVFHHLAAATKILDMKGPANCTSTVSSTLFKAMRVSESHKALIFNRPSVLSTPDWLTIPFDGEPKNALHSLTDVLLAIPGCIGLCGIEGSLGDFFSARLPDTTDLLPVRARTRQLLQEVDAWADRYPHLCSTAPSPQTLRMDLSARSLSDPPGIPTIMVPGTFAALIASSFYSARMTLALLLDKITPILPTSQSPGWSIMEDARSHTKSILQIAEFLELTNPVGFDFIRSIFPLVVVSNIAPLEEDRSRAMTMLERWGKKRAVSGLAGAKWIGN
ncbi:hypothetical protein BCR34DRAFT_484896 [Clohesyomyces aquaticus]|uniref:Fungal-specific transcription factor domain-domain-containing protein n=1 Tax=Clohesyomyces aquaticus TaxID=1231657 RepID=A0A1Y1ZL21_9PLEO|nr:hypothetical protein BCR34DRAFT_484896 [Clohesyomyces aquaticus]